MFVPSKAIHCLNNPEAGIERGRSPVFLLHYLLAFLDDSNDGLAGLSLRLLAN